jgi:UDP-glucose:(heptosyl)LPS alpha-1,3-glucosyltransferase
LVPAGRSGGAFNLKELVSDAGSEKPIRCGPRFRDGSTVCGNAPMRIAFAIMKLFPGGGLQRDCVEIARLVRARGHEVVVFTSHKDASDFADDLAIAILPVRQTTNHGMQDEFASMFSVATAPQNFDLRVGFDKLTHLDLLYCADPSIYGRMRKQRLLYLLPRYRTFLALERSTFGAAGRTKVLMLSHRQMNEYWNAWLATPERLAVLPPTISRARRRPELRADGVRAALRARLGFAPRDWVWIAVGVQPRTKGLDRTIRAMRVFPAAKLLVVGLTESSTHASKEIVSRAKRYGLTDRINWLGHHEDIPELMAAADLLVHPARRDTTGTVILEALVNGAPAVVTSICGYAQHVDAAQAGIVIDEPFGFNAFLAALAAAQDAGRRARWSAAGVQYGTQSFLYEGHARAAELILSAAAERTRRRFASLDNDASAEVVYLAARQRAGEQLKR